MSSNTAYRVNVGPHHSGTDESNLVNQSSPAWVLSFVSWQVRDTLRTSTNSPNATTQALVVENDCISLDVSVSKSSYTPQVTAVLIMTDVNYETAIAPGDFMFVNILNWEKDARRVAKQARDNTPINGPKDGFKGLFKVQGIRRTLSVDPNTGTRRLIFRINGYAFTEFNNSIYFNPNLIDTAANPNASLIFSSYIGQDWQNLINKKGIVNCQDIVRVLIESFIGTGVNDSGQFVKGIIYSPNTHFFMPSLIGTLLGIQHVQAAKDIYTYFFGIQQYNGAAAQSLASGLNPTWAPAEGQNPNGRFYYTTDKVQGGSFLKPEYWNQVKTWSILQQYSNAPLNEMYNCFRVSPTGNVMPTVVFRQMPFNNADFQSDLKFTKFISLPRWVIDPTIVYAEDIGRDESARINFVQYFGQSSIGINGSDMSFQTAQGNFLVDTDDVNRSGLRPYVITSYFDEPTAVSKTVYSSPLWAKIMGDCVIGGHLKLNGSLTTIGISQPIAVGDNIEYAGNIYHIEQVTHSCSISNGIKDFKSTIALSMGIHLNSTGNHPQYSQMEHPDAYKERQADWNNGYKILPGVSESQDTVYRPTNPDVTTVHPNAPESAFSQPNATPDFSLGTKNKD